MTRTLLVAFPPFFQPFSPRFFPPPFQLRPPPSRSMYFLSFMPDQGPSPVSRQGANARRAASSSSVANNQRTTKGQRSPPTTPARHRCANRSGPPRPIRPAGTSACPNPPPKRPPAPPAKPWPRLEIDLRRTQARAQQNHRRSRFHFDPPRSFRPSTGGWFFHPWTVFIHRWMVPAWIARTEERSANRNAPQSSCFGAPITRTFPLLAWQTGASRPFRHFS